MEQRLAGDYVDRVRADVLASIRERRRVRCGRDFETVLHRSISSLLRRRIGLLRQHNSSASVLPDELHRQIGDWKASIGQQELETAVRLRASQWGAAVSELIQRLELDWDQLVEHFGLAPDAQLVDIGPPLGDPHNGGRSVYKLEFDTGRAIIYKPRSVVTEHIFGRMVQWLGRHGCEPVLTPCLVKPQRGYGWADVVLPLPCRTPQEAEAYYERQGAFLALFFLIRGGDCIWENVIGHVDHPVWIDVECVCYPGFPERPLIQPVPTWMSESILRTSFVFHANSMRIPPRLHTALAVSCLEDRFEVFTPNDVLRERYILAVITGFEKVYEWILAHRRAWTARDGPLSWWQGERVRFLPVPTMIYEALTECLMIAPEGARMSARRAVEQALRSRRGMDYWPDGFVETDIKAIERGDVPYWSMSTSSRDLVAADGWVASNVFERSGMDCVWSRASQMSGKNLDDQVWLINSFLRLPNVVAALEVSATAA